MVATMRDVAQVHEDRFANGTHRARHVPLRDPGCIERELLERTAAL